MAKLSQTDAQLATSITIRALKRDPNISSLTDEEAIRELSEKSVKIGAIESFTEATPRPTNPRYQLDADKAGDMIERIPQLVDRTLRISRAILYTADIFQAFGFTDIVDIADQNIPFTIVKVERVPEGSTAITRTTAYEGCWFHDNPRTIDIGGDLKVMQDVEIGYTRRFVA